MRSLFDTDDGVLCWKLGELLERPFYKNTVKKIILYLSINNILSNDLFLNSVNKLELSKNYINNLISFLSKKFWYNGIDININKRR